MTHIANLESIGNSLERGNYLKANYKAIVAEFAKTSPSDRLRLDTLLFMRKTRLNSMNLANVLGISKQSFSGFIKGTHRLNGDLTLRLSKIVK
jgi:hypothetical protein